MPLVAPAGQYYDSLQTFGHFPGGPRGSAGGAVAGVALKYAYRGAKYLARRFFKPKKTTYSGATGRGIAIGTGIASLFSEEDDLNGTQIPIRKTPNRQFQRNRGFRGRSRSRRSYHKCRPRNCC